MLDERNLPPTEGWRSRVAAPRFAVAFLIALAGSLLAATASAQAPAPWSFLSPPDDIPYVTTADPSTGLPRPGENGELFFSCFEDVYVAGVIVDAGPPDGAAVQEIAIGGDVYAATGDGSGWYALETAPGAGDFGIAASLAAYAFHTQTVLGQAGVRPTFAVEAVADGQRYPLVVARTGGDFGALMERLDCVPTGDFTADTPPADDPSSDAPAADPLADAPARPGGASAAGSAPVPSQGPALADLLAAGGEVRLGSGTYRLPYDVTVSNDLRLIGAGVDATTLVMPPISVAGIAASGADLTIQGLTVRVDAPAGGSDLGFADAISAFDGDLILRDLVVVNVADHGDIGVSGVTLLSGTLSGSDVRIEGFSYAGIYVEDGVANLRDVRLLGNRNGIQLEGFEADQPYAELRDATLSNNTAAGIAVYDDAFALVSDAEIRGNGGEAAYVRGTGSLTLEDVEIADHAEFGVVAEGGRAVVRGATLAGNRNAIWALLDSTVTVERSDIVNSAGFAVAGNGTGRTTLQRVTIEGSELSAVHAEEARSLTVEASFIGRAGESGVNLVGDARAEVRDSRIEGSGVNGVEVRDGAHATIVNTTLAGNASFGLLVEAPATHELLGVTYEANGAGPLQLPEVASAPSAPSEPAPTRPSRPSRSGAGQPATTAPSTPSTPSATSAGASGSWQLDDASELLTYQDGARAFGFVCGASDSGEPVVYLALPDASVSSTADDLASFDVARSDGTLGSATWNFLDLGDGLFLTDEIATGDIVEKLVPDEGSSTWNTVVFSLPGQGPVLAVPGESRVADLFVQLTCTQ